MINIDKKYKTRDGREVRLLCTDAPGIYPVVGIIAGLSGINTWSITGESYVFQGKVFNLIEVPNTRKQTFYRRKYCLNNKYMCVAIDFNFYPTKEAFDSAHTMTEGSVTWSDEWEEIAVEVKV